MELSRRQFVVRGVLGAASLGLIPRVGWAAEAFAAVGKGRKPNIVFILADDLGWRDTSLYGSAFYETPNIEELARRGMMFTQAYAANPYCSPTRASILTGLYPDRIGITTPACHLPNELFEASLPAKFPPDRKVIPVVGATRLRLEYVTMAETLREAGYATGHYGKWHLGHAPYDPVHQGFDKYVPNAPFLASPPSYMAPWAWPPDVDYDTGQPGENIEDRMASEAIQFIREHRDVPFYLNYWPFSVHEPIEGKPELIERYKAKVQPDSLQGNPIYAAMVQTLDENVGRLMRTLDELGIAQDTIVVFFSDNGGYLVRRDGMPITSNAPLRAGKGAIYEGGVREPCVFVWPDKIAAGVRSEAVISSIDFFPTLLALTGVAAPPDVEFDGISIVPALRGRPLRREAIFCHLPHPQTDGSGPATWVRQGDRKLIRFYADNDDGGDRFELYNLRKDVGETDNLADRKPDLVRKLDGLISRHLAETKAVVPERNPDYDPSATAETK